MRRALVLNMTDKPQTPSTANILQCDINRILNTIPHRYPFLLVDRVTELVPGEYAIGYKNVSMNEPFFQGHFPGNPIMPGVLILEAMAQLGSILVQNMAEGQGKLGMFSGIDSVRFRRPVVPGDRLDLKVELLKIRSNIGKARGIGMVDGQIAAEGEIMFALVDSDAQNGRSQ